ncbi:preprotein translocase subunit SecE [Candidatus Dojkabacteria bacterium]|nr:preprotein translocase subunit SecE [Candidatus Dojkabacteria bacterium]
MKFLKNIISELKKSTWPSKKDVLNMTIYVLIISILLSLTMVFLDLGLAHIRDWFLKI